MPELPASTFEPTPQTSRCWTPGARRSGPSSSRSAFGSGSRPRTHSDGLFPDEQARFHPERAMIAERAPQLVAAGRQLRRERRRLLGRDDARAPDLLAADAAQAEVVRILAEVRQLDQRAAGLDRVS